MNLKLKLGLRPVIGLVLFVAFAAFIYRTSVFRISKNFTVVEDGKLYRSAQLTTQELEEAVQKYHIKTVISLRGSPGETSYYEREADTLTRLQVKFVPVPLSDDFYPNENDLRIILTEFESGQYPILIHCRVGADRTGMIAALYERAYSNKSVDESLNQLTFKNWHVPLFKPAMSSFVKKFKNVKWALNDYHVCNKEFDDHRETDYVCKK